MPRPLQRLIEHGIARERADGREAQAAAIATHYGEVMPRMREEQRAHPLFRARLAWDRLPRLSSAIDRLAAICAEAGVPFADPRGAATLAELYGATHYGGAMPMLYGYPADLEYIVAREPDPIAAIDRFLTAPIIHELCHFTRDREVHLPIHLDECIGGWLACHVVPGEDDLIYAAPWLAQVGQAIARAFTLRATLRTHAGVERALPDAFLAEATELARADWDVRRSLHFLADPMDPEPWLALIEPHVHPIADPALDLAILEDALAAMCQESVVVDGSYRTRRVFPTGPITIRDRRVTCGALRYWIPLDVEATVTIEERAALPSIARDIASPPSPPRT